MKKTETKEAIQELTMILMYLTRFAENEKFFEAQDFYAWKGYDFDVINQLWDDDYIRQGKHPSKSKKVYLTESGKAYAQELLEKYHIEDWKKE